MIALWISRKRGGRRHSGTFEADLPRSDRMDAMNDPISDAKSDALGSDGKLKRKDYERELARLHVEFVKLQQWVVHKGLKVCILFEGRDGAGKGGTIKAMTERVSPRIFRVVALPAPTEREKSQMYAQRYIPHLPEIGRAHV